MNIPEPTFLPVEMNTDNSDKQFVSVANQAVNDIKMVNLFERNIPGVCHCDSPVSIHYPQYSSTRDLHHPQSQKKEIHSNGQKRQTHLYPLAEILDRRAQKAQRSSESRERQDEYLSVALPLCPAHPIRIYGAAVNADMRFVMRAELILSILRLVSSRMECTTSIAEQDYFDDLLMEASAALSGMSLRQERRRKRRTCRGLIKILLRLEERQYRIRS